MNIPKLALPRTLRIAFIGSLKVALCVYTLFLSDAARAQTTGSGGVGPASRHNATGLLNENFLTSTGQTVAHPGASQGTGTTELDRRIEQQNDRIEESICGNCK